MNARNSTIKFSSTFLRALLFFLFLSWISSAYGLFELFKTTIPIQNPILIVFGLGIAALITSFVIQALVGAFWWVSFEANVTIALRCMTLFGGIATSIFSGALAAAFWLFIFGAHEYERLLNDRQYATIAIPLNEFAQNQDIIAREFGAFSAQMDREMGIEKDEGASCDGPAVLTGQGPRYRLRDRLKSEAAHQSATVSSIASSARDAIRLPANVNDATMHNAWEKASAIARNPALSAAQEWVSKLQIDFSTEHFDQETKKSFICRDSEVLSALYSLSEKLDNRIVLPMVPPRAISVDRLDSLENSFGQVWSVIGPVMGFSVKHDREALDRTRPGFMLAIFVESAIIFFTLLTAMMRPREPKSLIPSTSSTVVPEQEREKVRVYKDMLDTLSMPVGGTEYLFIPEDGDDDQRKVAKDFASRWSLKPTKIGQMVEIDKMTESGPNFFVSKFLREKTGGAKFYTIYRMSADAIRFRDQSYV